MKIGYIRVSTQEQNTIRQEVLMESLGVEEVYIDRMSGKNTNHPQLQKMMDYVRHGDVVIVESISRFARNTRDLLELVERLSAVSYTHLPKSAHWKNKRGVNYTPFSLSKYEKITRSTPSAISFRTDD